MHIGIKNSLSIVVADNQTAESFETGLLPVYATPHMIQLMEKTARLSVQPFLGEGQGTVGTVVNVRHLKGALVGERVICESELIEADRRRLVFKVVCFNDRGTIGEGTHERFIIDCDKFIKKLTDETP